MDYLIAVALLCGVVAGAIGSSKGETLVGFIAGLLLGPIGILLAIVSSGNRRPCPFCRELIDKQAIVCPHYQRELAGGERP